MVLAMMIKKTQTSTCKYSVLGWSVLLAYAECGLRGTLRPAKSAKEQICFSFSWNMFYLIFKTIRKIGPLEI